MQEAWSEGKFYLLPSFLHLLSFLAARSDNRDSDSDSDSHDTMSSPAYEFKLVFRTFGDDIPEVAKELELLVDGKHPFCPGTTLPDTFKLDVSPGSARVGTFYRDGYSADGTALAVGTLMKLPFSSANRDDPRALETFYNSSDNDSASGTVEIVRGFAAIQNKLAAMLRESTTLALRDYWEWWSAHAENGEYGKLLLVDDSDSSAATVGTDDSSLTVFFDDHIEAHHAHIVDVRDVRSGAVVPFETSNGRFLQRVEPFAAITDEQYFVRLVAKILQDAEDASSKL